MNILSGTDDLLRNLNTTQQDLSTLTSRLSTGLRIEGASDDPSGYAISESLQSRVGGLQQAVENVQTGGNLLTVADGAAATIQQILQRVRSLIVEAHSDINSDTQLSAIQTEMDSMLSEINRISSNANFNGVTLFNGSHDTTVVNPNATPTILEVSPGPNPDGSVPTTDSVSSPQYQATSSAKLISGLNETGAGQWFTGLVIFRVTGYSNDPTDPTLGVQLGKPGVYVEVDAYSADSTFSGGIGNSFTQTSAVATGQASFYSTEPIPSSVSGNQMGFYLQSLSAADVGTAIAFEITKPTTAVGGGTAITINDSGQEGGTVSMSLPTLSTNALGISNISVMPPSAATPGPGGLNYLPDGMSTSNDLAARDAENRVDAALDQISSLRAQLGAQMVSTQEDAQNDNVTSVNLAASESSIRDLNIGAATTQYTKDQILVQVGTSVLSQYEVDARQLASLMINALVA